MQIFHQEIQLVTLHPHVVSTGSSPLSPKYKICNITLPNFLKLFSTDMIDDIIIRVDYLNHTVFEYEIRFFNYKKGYIELLVGPYDRIYNHKNVDLKINLMYT